VDLDAATSTDLPTSSEDALLQLRALADKDAVRALGVLYSVAVDDHDLDRVVRCFAADGSFERAGVTYAGHEKLRTFYAAMMGRYLTTLHIPQSHVIVVDAVAGTARGLLAGQAQLVLGGRLLMAAYRYEDSYVRLDRRWVFQARKLTFMYNVPFDEMATSFGDDLRIRVPGLEPTVADFPEGLPTWG
jgi:hypothetical protein